MIECYIYNSKKKKMVATPKLAEPPHQYLVGLRLQLFTLICTFLHIQSMINNLDDFKR